MKNLNDVSWDIIKTIVFILVMGSGVFWMTHRDIIDLQAEAKELTDSLSITRGVVEEHTTDIAVLKNDVNYIKEGVKELVEDKRRRRGE